MRSPLASGVERLFATRSLHPISSFRHCSFAHRLHHRSQQPVAFQLSSICNRPLFDQNSRLRLASEQSCDCSSPTELRVLIDVSSIHLLAKPSALKLRLERFRTSHARVQVNLLLSRIGASEITSIFVNILFKTCPCCGAGWIRKRVAEESTNCGARIFFGNDLIARSSVHHPQNQTQTARITRNWGPWILLPPLLNHYANRAFSV